MPVTPATIDRIGARLVHALYRGFHAVESRLRPDSSQPPDHHDPDEPPAVRARRQATDYLEHRRRELNADLDGRS